MRDEFGEEVKRALALRVNHRCSNPDCRAPTSGPKVDPAGHLNVGVAAHITAAAPGGPRFEPSISSPQRRHSDNGLWLCQTCAKMIDNDAARFPAVLLRDWKAGAEREALAAVGKAPAPKRRAESVTPTGMFVNVPPRNLCFSGRDDVLEHIRRTLVDAPVVALTGLPGVGKTETAAEYVHRHGDEWNLVLWINADTDAAQRAGFVGAARLLGLAPQEGEDLESLSERLRHYVRGSSSHLLVLNNLPDLGEFALFSSWAHGSPVLVTTLAPATGNTAVGIEMVPMTPDEGADLVLRRAKLIGGSAASADVREQNRQAVAVSEALGGLPLALDQAGAYMEEAGLTPAQYLKRYRQRRSELLRRRGRGGGGHPLSVEAAFSLAFRAVEERSPAAADVLRLCAYLIPHDIPEEIFFSKGVDLGGPLNAATVDEIAWDGTVEAARAFALLQRDPARCMLGVHSLVQDVLLEAMSEEERRTWALRAVECVDVGFMAFPDPFDPRKDLFFPQLIAATQTVISLDLRTTRATRALSSTAFLMSSVGRLADAENLFYQSLTRTLENSGENHPNVAIDLDNLAGVFWMQGKVAEAEAAQRHALEILEGQEPKDYNEIAAVHNNLGIRYHGLGQMHEAEDHFRQALQAIGADPIFNAAGLGLVLNGLATVLGSQGRFSEAEPALRACREISVDG